KRVLVMDALPFPDSVPEHVAQYRGAILKESAGFIEKTVFGRQELLEVYAALRHVLRRPYVYPDLIGLGNAVPKRGGRSTTQVELALKMFIELGLLLECKTQTGYSYALAPTAGRTSLDRSESYNRMQAYVSLATDMAHA
ncbi:MAG: hypothetical protein ACOYU3_04115, partial [Bacillota bacterium]